MKDLLYFPCIFFVFIFTSFPSVLDNWSLLNERSSFVEPLYVFDEIGVGIVCPT